MDEGIENLNLNNAKYKVKNNVNLFISSSSTSKLLLKLTFISESKITSKCEIRKFKFTHL